MARLPRLAVAAECHLVLLPALPGLAPFPDGSDRAAFLDALREAAASVGVRVHAYALLASEARLLLTPPEAAALSLAVQQLGRCYVSAYNRQYVRRGTIWSGRFRACVVEPGAPRGLALRYVDSADHDPGTTSAAHRLGGPRQTWLVDPPEYWALGNTPFERESAYGALLAGGLDAGLAERLRRSALRGWPFGSPQFIAGVAALTSRSVAPRARGRPRRPA